MKAYTDLEQSKKLAEILPLESADVILPFTHKENNEYVPGYAVSRNYIEVYNEMLLLRTMDKDTICKLMQPCWSLAALLDNIPQVKLDNIKQYDKKHWRCCAYFASDWHNSDWCDNPVDACYEMIIILHEQKLL